MNPRIINLIIILGLVAAIIFVLIEYKRPKQANPVSNTVTVAPVVTNPPTTPATSTARLTTHPLPVVQQSASNQASLTQEQKMEQLKQSIENYSQQLHRPIEFYGMVVDESNSPVAGANINLIWTHYILPETTYDTNLLSDASGMFSISGITGADLEISVTKDGYYPVNSQNPTKFSYSETYGRHPFRPDPNNPIVFHLRKKGEGVNLITAELDVPAPLDGTPIFADVLNHRVGQSGQIELSQIKPDSQHWKKANEWKFRMSIQDGGFIAENDEFPFEAPEAGYEPTVEFDFKRGDPNWITTLRTNYYIKFGNPPIYGRLNLATFIDLSDARLIYAINPDGSRDLESK